MIKKTINFLFLLFCLLSINNKVFALTYGGCEYSEIARLKSIVSNINISYEYYIKDNRAYFNITLNNVVPEIYFIDSSSGNKYTYNNTIDGELTIRDNTQSSGHYDFYSAMSKCYGVKLLNKYYNLPMYNYYYMDPLCKENQNHSLCQKWSNVNYTYDEFKRVIREYNENKNKKDENIVIYEETILDMIVRFYVENYYFILLGIIVVCGSIMLIYRRKNRFDL